MSTKPPVPKPITDLYSDDGQQKFLEDLQFSDESLNPAWDLERSTPMGTLKDMIRKYHTPDTATRKPVAIAQVLRIEEGMQSLYQTLNPDDSETNVQLIRYRVLSDRRHYWLPEPKTNIGSQDNQIISLHPLAVYKLPTGEAASTIEAGSLVEVRFKDTKTAYSSYIETAEVLGLAGHVDSSEISIKRGCSDIVLPPLPKDSNAESLTQNGDPCLIVGDVAGYSLETAKSQAAANNKKLVFPRFPVTTGEVLTSEFGKLRTTRTDDGRTLRRIHYGADYDVSKGTSLVAAFDGKVTIAKYNPGGFGNYVVIEHSIFSTKPNEDAVVFWTLYGHMGSDPREGETAVQAFKGASPLKVGQYVKRGQNIGIGGNSGLSVSAGGGDGSHLHFEYIVELPRKSGFPGFSKNILRQTRKDPQTDFFRRGFFVDPRIERLERSRAATRYKPLSRR